MAVYAKEKAEIFDASLRSNIEEQTLKPDEFVLVCDGALTSELDDVIARYAALYPDTFKVYRKEKEELGLALRYGLERCSYPLVARSDSDDICVPTRFETQVRYMDEHPEVGVISAYIDEFQNDWTKPLRTKTLPLTHEELYEKAKFRNPLNHMAVMMRRDDIIRIGSYIHLPYIEDYELWVRALVDGIKLSNIGEVLVHARVGEGMVARRGKKRNVRSYHTVYNYMVKHGMISRTLYLRNMFTAILFLFIPSSLRSYIYNSYLRN